MWGYFCRQKDFKKNCGFNSTRGPNETWGRQNYLLSMVKINVFSAFVDACALLFDHSNCRDLKRDVPQGYTALGLLDKVKH